MSDEPGEDAERHASWPELFLDLVVVAGFGVVAHEASEASTWLDVGVLALAFTAAWLLWAAATTYGNLAGDRTRFPVLLAVMASIGVMLASVPDLAERAGIFTLAYLVGRLVVAAPWARGAVVLDLPTVQTGLGLVPWIVSLWVPEESRYAWWAAGIAIDILRLLTRSPERLTQEAERRYERVLARGAEGRKRGAARTPRRGGGRRGRNDAAEPHPFEPRPLAADVGHLSERMGLFILIALGEGMIQVMHAASEADWDRHLAVAGFGTFALVIALFVVLVRWGTAGMAMLRTTAVPLRLLWAGHLVVSMALVTLAMALGRILEHASEPLSARDAVTMAVAFGIIGLASAAAMLVSDDDARVGSAAVIAAVPLAGAALVAARAGEIHAGALAWILTGVTAATAALVTAVRRRGGG